MVEAYCLTLVELVYLINCIDLKIFNDIWIFLMFILYLQIYILADQGFKEFIPSHLLSSLSCSVLHATSI